MLECRACVQHYIRAIAGPELRVARSRRPLLLTPRLPSQLTKRHASASGAFTTSNGFADGLVPGKQPTSDPKDDKGLTHSDKKALQRELDFLSDPVKLADHVRYTLRSGQPEKALNLCRLASKKREVIVSWNQCVDWYMQQGKVDDAIKVYNEMKKRAQFPDSYTYVHLLRGLAHPSQLKDGRVRESNVVKAVSIYNSMSSPTSRVKPSIFHANAVLKVCSAALDMDALWGIVSQLPSTGAGAPDHQTYTILLNAIRFSAFGNFSDTASLEQISARRTKAVEEGRRIWQEIIPKWRAGEIHVDSELVGVMGRLLLISKRMHDWDDVLNLVQQTMNIERLVPALGHPDRRTEHVPQEHDLPEPEPEAEDIDGYVDAPSTKAFHRVHPLPPDSAYPNRPTTLAWVQSENRTLSLLIEACTLLRTPKTATAYWDLLTSPPYDIKPDLTNFHDQLHLLSKNRSSAKAATLLTEHLAAAGIEPKNQTFRIAMSVCARDKNNTNALAHARAIVDVMENTTPDPDVHTLIQYLNLALLTDDGKKIAGALDRLDPIVHNLRSSVSYGTDERATSSLEKQVEVNTQTIHFFQTIVGVIDTLMNRGLVPRDEYTHWHGRRSQLTQFIGGAKNRVAEQRRKLEETQGPPGRKSAAWKRNVEGKTALSMSKEQWALKTFRWKDRQNRERGETRERNRQRAIGVRDWDFRQAEFADSPADLPEGGRIQRHTVW